jgi:hypothetical protein
MHDMALEAAGALAILVAIVHGTIGELRVLPNARIAQPRTRNLLRVVWQASTVDWIGMGVLLIAAPALGSPARQWVVAVAGLMYGYAAVGNALANRGRHIGAFLMAAVIALALAGL